jgi:hypothetical protein
MTAAKPKRGRPSKYRQEFVEQARKLAMLGLTNEEMAWFFGVDVGEFALWAWSDEAFFNAITPTSQQRQEWKSAREAERQKRRAAKRRRLENSIHERIANSMRARMWVALKGKSSGGYLSRLGYTIEQLKKHLESKFSPGMSWENYGRWHVDHIRPCASFDLADEDQFAECWALENLQPLWAADNVRKGARYGCA